MMNVYILYPSWEERSYLGLKKYLLTNNVDLIYIIEKKDGVNKIETQETLTDLERFCQVQDIKYLRIVIDQDEKETYEKVTKMIEGIDVTHQITLDITTMSRNIIWILLFSIRQKHKVVKIVYSLPEHYCEDWISKEPSTPSLLFKHSGIIDLDLKNCLAIITGFDTERTKQLVKFYDPQKIILLVQSTDEFNNHTRNSSDDHLKVCLELGYSSNNIETKFLDVYKTDLGFAAIESTTSEYKSDYNLIFASLGPKLSAISLYQVFLNNPEIALSYVPSKKYNPNYCKGIGKQIIHSITF